MADLLPSPARSLDYDEIGPFLARRLGDDLLAVVDEYGTFELVTTTAGYVEAARLCRDERRLNFDLFDCLFGVDAREHGFDLVAILYSTASAMRVCLRTRCEGGREAPVAPTLTHLYRGADWMEREAWDMFGIEFADHPGLAPRILCAENFEGWPLRKDFYLATREAKPWPGVKEPAELDEHGNVIERVPGPGEAVGPSALDEAMAKQAKLANPEAEPAEVVRDAGATVVASGDDGAVTPSAASAQPDERVAPGDAERAAEDATDDESRARARAEEKRRAAAEARSRRAAERGDAATVSTPTERTADVPKDADRDPGATDAGGPPSTPTGDPSGAHEGESPIAAGIDEAAEDARRRGEVTPAEADAPVRPEGRDPSPNAADDDRSDADEGDRS